MICFMVCHGGPADHFASFSESLSRKGYEVQVIADGILYYQTSMGPQFALAGIPTMQMGHNVYEDLLVRNGLCATATAAEEFLEGLACLDNGAGRNAGDSIQQALGFCSDWEGRLELALKALCD